MPPKLDTPLKPSQIKKIPRSNSKSKLETVSNEDLMASLNAFKVDVLSSTQAQYKDLKNNLLNVSNQILELKAENSKLRKEVDDLKDKVASLECNSHEQSQTVVTQVLLETFARERCQSNLIIYGVPESLSEVSVRITHDKATIVDLLRPLGEVVPPNAKLVRLGKPRSEAPRPIKLICNSKESALSLLSTFNSAKSNGLMLPEGFRMTSDKTELQRKLLHDCYADLERRMAAGESGLRVIFENGLPKIQAATSRNREFNRRPFNRS